MPHKTTVLLVEDNPDINAINQEALENEGYEVLVATTMEQAESMLSVHTIDVVVLDILLPDGSGLEFCKTLTSKMSIPILFLTALDNVSQRVEGLKAGGDDYLTKPYHLDELCARVEALVRRASRLSLPTTIGYLKVDYVSQRVYIKDKDALLKPREFALFVLLLQNQNSYLSVEEVYHAVWKADSVGDVRTVYAHISRLRKKLSLHEDDENADMYLEHDRGKGYRLIIRQS